MNEFIEKLNKRLEEIKDDTGINCSKVDFNKCNKYKNCGVCIVDRAIDIVNELAEEYKGDRVNQLAMMYAQNMYMYGVDVTKAWKNATSQSAALNKAYLRGLYDERKYQYTQMKNHGGWIPCSERLPDNEDYVLCWYEYYRFGSYNRMYQTYGLGYYIKQYNMWGGEVNQGQKCRVIAWQPLPAPYNPKGE